MQLPCWPLGRYALPAQKRWQQSYVATLCPTERVYLPALLAHGKATMATVQDGSRDDLEGMLPWKPLVRPMCTVSDRDASTIPELNVT